MRSASVWLAACSLAAGLASCGGKTSDTPGLPQNYAGPAAIQADRIARVLDARRPCKASSIAALLQRSTIRAINDRRIPSGVQEELLSRVNGLAGVIPCSRPAAGSPAQDARDLAQWLRARAD